MSFHLDKCIDVTPAGTINPGGAQDWAQFRAGWPDSAELAESCTHIRFWLDWPNLQPFGNVAFDDTVFWGGKFYFKLLALDGQIRQANRDGLKVILMPYRYPRWVNGTHGILSGTSDENLWRSPQDRVRLEPPASGATPWLDFFRDQGNPTRRAALAAALRQLEFELPAEGHGLDQGGRPEPEPETGRRLTEWARFVKAIFDRYVRHGDTFGRADFIEVVNEPNLQLWPQRSPAADQSWPDHVMPQGRFGIAGSRLTVHEAVAEMMTTVDWFARRYEQLYGTRVLCLAPSTSDTSVTTVPRLSTIAVDTPYGRSGEPFVDLLLDELRRRAFKGGGRWIWAYHNYNDMEFERDGVAYLRRVLRRKRWTGRKADDGPALMATEGGVRLSAITTRYGIPVSDTAGRRAKQAEVLDRAFRLHRRTVGVGAGVQMLTQYSIFADPNFDCGIRDRVDAGRPGDKRAAWDAWCALKTFDPHDPPPSVWQPEEAAVP